MKYELPKLPYSYDALEPFIDARTMEIHHTKHHQAYIDKLNGVLEKYPDLADEKIEDLLKKMENLTMSPADKVLLKNHGGGHLNHSLFWQIMGVKKEPDAPLLEQIKKDLISVENFKKQFTAAALSHFGSGWAWLSRDEKGILQVYSLPNQDSPILLGHIPIIGLDVWEHAYYLKYQNKRAEYIENWWKVLKLIQ